MILWQTGDGKPGDPTDNNVCEAAKRLRVIRGPPFDREENQTHSLSCFC